MPLPSTYNLEHFNFCNQPLSIFYMHCFFLLSLLQSQKPHEIILLEQKKYLVIAISLQRLLMMPKLLLLSSMVPFLCQGIEVLHPLDQYDPRYRLSNLLSPVGHILDPYDKHHRTSPHCTLCRHSRIYQDLVYDS